MILIISFTARLFPHTSFSYGCSTPADRPDRSDGGPIPYILCRCFIPPFSYYGSHLATTSVFYLSNRARSHTLAFSPPPSLPTRHFSDIRRCADRTTYPVYFDYEQLTNYTTFETKILKNISPDISYKVYIKFKFDNEIYKMAGHQFAFNYPFSDYSNIYLLFKRANLLLDFSMSKYGFKGMVDSILFTFKVVDGPRFIKPITLRNLSINQTKLARTKLYNFNKPLPLTCDIRKYGLPLTPHFTKEKIISHFSNPNYLDGVFKDFGNNYIQQVKTLDIKKQFLIEFKPEGLYYLLPDEDLLLYIVINLKVSTKYIFDSSGVLITTVVDTIIDTKNFTRQIGNVSMVIEENTVVNYAVRIKLNPIRTVSKKVLDISNPSFGTIDLETYLSDDGFNKVYAAGFYVYDKAFTYYIDENLNSEKVVLDCINAILVKKYHNFVFYAHNLSGYDGPFILKCLLDYNDRAGSCIYTLDNIFRDNRIISMTISKRIYSSDKDGKGKTVKITILDSYLMLNSSLSKLGSSYEVEVIKGIFPHSFASPSTLFYKGVTPNKNLFKDIKDEDYLKIPTDQWDFKVECLKYLELDLKSLYLIMKKFKKEVHLLYGVEVLNAITISRLAFDIFMEKYYKDNIALINHLEMYSCIKEGYFGAIPEVYKPYGEDLYYYDVNSLYPYAALNDMPGLNCTYIDFLTKSPCIEELFGFYYCEVECKINYLGLLPLRTPEGSVILPYGI